MSSMKLRLISCHLTMCILLTKIDENGNLIHQTNNIGKFAYNDE